MCGSDESHLYLERSFTYRTEQARANVVQRVIMYSMDDYPITKNILNAYIYVRKKQGPRKHWITDVKKTLRGLAL